MSVDLQLIESIKNEAKTWIAILQRILDVVLYLGLRGLAFRGSNELIGDPKNGNFLGSLQLISHYDTIMHDHLEKESQKIHKRLQVHYLSPESQNEFIDCCASHVRQVILEERAKYYSIIVDATPDSAHMEHTVFILRYVLLNEDLHRYEIHERFLEFADSNKKTEKAIAELIQDTLRKHQIPFAECRGQGYDNGSNMNGQYKGAQREILNNIPFAIFSPCGCHTLNLCGVQAAECCSQVLTFYGVVQKLFNTFSSSPQRWEILQKKIGCSLHSLSQTRWSARVECVKPFAAHIPGITEAIIEIETVNLTPETRFDIKGTKTYMESFECTLLASIWLKVLTTINY
ncbi:zinc finger MYM-type protein 1-like [Solenopsis invicta]|uniref:zinc finger MYM-type protein 1-like n=1 Tax=Solenopsis invicta TaxID=13686 RepID=UPI0005959D77|nr:zinc finger MYM-type protein 1-like [Solenopsis invicta]